MSLVLLGCKRFPNSISWISCNPGPVLISAMLLCNQLAWNLPVAWAKTLGEAEDRVVKRWIVTDVSKVRRERWVGVTFLYS